MFSPPLKKKKKCTESKKSLNECIGLIHRVLWKPGGKISYFIKPSMFHIVDFLLFSQTYKLNTSVIKN